MARLRRLLRPGLAPWSSLASCLMVAASGCATYTLDLERARKHYQDLEFPKALAVLRALGEERDALTAAEQVQFAYLRGMTDMRLSETVPPDGNTIPQLRACARDWLALALAQEKSARGSLSPDQMTRAQATLAKLIDVEAPPGACTKPRAR